MAGKLGERPLLIFSTLWRAFLMTFLTALADRNGKLSEGLRQVYAKEIAVGIDINARFRRKQEQSDDKAQRKRRSVVLGGFLPFIKLYLTSL